MQRGITAYINLSAVAYNYHIVKSIAKNQKIISVIKADAYGCGAIEVARQLIKEGTDYLAVAFSSEAIELRDAGIQAPIIVLFDTEYDYCVKYNLIPVVSSTTKAQELNRAASKANIKLPIHIKIDTGMGRMGILYDEATTAIDNIAQMHNLRIQGILSHFSLADCIELSESLVQLNKFISLKDILSSKGINVPMYHIANSAGIINIPKSLLDAVRPGIMLYGINPIHGNNVRLLPVMTLKTSILDIKLLPAGHPVSYNQTFITQRPTKIALLAMGYADGFNRLFSNNAEVLICGKRAKVIGRVCMDLTIVDVTDIENVSPNDEVVILGKQYDEIINAESLSCRINTIPYEILTTFGRMARRIYIFDESLDLLYPPFLIDKAY